MPTIQFKSIKTGSLVEQVLGVLHNAIFSGQLLPGTPLREIHLAKDLGVSQTTVREALRELEHAGLAVRNPSDGTVVKNLNPEEIHERVSLRGLLENEAGLQASQRMNEDDFAELNAALKDLKRTVPLIAEGSYVEMTRADLVFHRCIWRKSGNTTLYETLDRLTAPLFAFFCIRLVNRELSKEGLVDFDRRHEVIVSALRQKDRKVITAAFRQHIKYFREIDALNGGAAKRRVVEVEK